MFEKIASSWNLAKECWHVLMLDKEMLAFPALSTVATLLVSGLATYPFWKSGYAVEAETVRINFMDVFSLTTIFQYTFLTIVLPYFVYVIVTFFNSGLVTCAYIRLKGGDPVLSDGLKIAWKRLPKILTWSVLVAIVGLLLRMVKGKNNFLRSLVGGMLGLGWRVASFFAIPVIVVEEKGAVDALKRSAELIKKNWGDALIVEIGLSVLAFPAMLFVFLFFGLSSYVEQSMPMLSAFFSIIAVAVIFVSISVISTLDAISKAALYMVASGDGKIQNFNRELLGTMFKRSHSEANVFA